MTRYENMVIELRRAADEWRADHPSVSTFETRYDLALLDAASAIEELSAKNKKLDEAIKRAYLIINSLIHNVTWRKQSMTDYKVLADEYDYAEIVRELRQGASTSRDLYLADAIEELSRRAAEWEVVSESWQKACKGLESRMPRWIPVTERLPEEDTICILTNGVSDAIGYRGKVFGWHLIWTDYLVESEVTHWMPLPPPPKEKA